MKRLLLLSLGSILLNINVLNAQNSIFDPFFDQVDYIGAFGPVDWTQGWANYDPQGTVYASTTVTVNGGDITSNTTWTASNVYLLNGWVYVKSGAVLTIEPGTVIRGDKTNKGTLIVERGGQVIAEGTPSQPIIFTSNQAAGSRDYGDWGGLIICGKATVNQAGGEATIEGGVGAVYGGGATPDDNDNSGILKYIRVEFPGVAFAPNNEINGLTFGGVGRGTLVDYIQVSYCGDDSYEWFGGTVNAKHLIAFRGWDDEFDTDNGFSGMVQFAVGLRDPAVADVSGSNGFESDNDASGSLNQPFTSPLFSNVSLFGPKVDATTIIHTNYKRSMHLRRSTKLNVYNSIFLAYPLGLLVDGSGTQANAMANDLKVRNCMMGGMGQYFSVPDAQTWTVADARAWYFTPAFFNDTLVDNSQLMISDPFNLALPNFLPLPNSPVLQSSSWLGLFENRRLEVTMQAYPNPSFSGQVQVSIQDLKNDATLYLVNSLGQEIMQWPLSAQPAPYVMTLDLSGQSAGLYLLGLVSGKVRSFQRILLQ